MSSTTIDTDIRRELIKAAGTRRAETETMYKSLATEIAMDINTIENILANHGLTLAHFNAIARKPMFEQYLHEATVVWGATASAKVRIQAKMEALVEAALPELAKALMADGALTPAKVQLVQAMMKGGGIGASDQPQGAQGVRIVIDMGAVRAERAAPVVTIDHDAEDM